MVVQLFLAHAPFQWLQALHVVNAVVLTGAAGAFTGHLVRIARSGAPAATPAP